MRKRVDKMNVSPEIRDVRSGSGQRGETPIRTEDLERFAPEQPFPPPSPERPMRFWLLFWVIAAALGLAFYAYFPPGSAEPSEVGSESGEELAKLGDIFANLAAGFGGIQKLSANGLALFRELGSLEREWPDLMLDQKGGELLARLESIKKRIGELRGAVGSISGGGGLGLESDLIRADDFLAAFIPWLGSEEPRRIAVLLQNPSELRPGGGFIGSYTELVIRKGSLESMEVRDINDPDRELTVKMIPPRPLQGLVSRWRAADANWFLDFPVSARKVLGFLEASEFYSREQKKFDGLIGLSATVISDLLKETGPIVLRDGKLILDDGNFLVEIQKQVQTGQAEGSDYPKSVLREFAPILTEKIKTLPADRRAALFRNLSEWVGEKDIQAFFKENAIQDFFRYLGASGESFRPPQNWYGDYLAVTAANVGGGKSDLFLEQRTELKLQLEEEGGLAGELNIVRKHSGDRSEFWWYKVPSQSYIQVYVPEGAKLTEAAGGRQRTITPRSSYAGFETDPELKAIESSREKLDNFPAWEKFRNGGKDIFATWSRVESGAEDKMSLRYFRRLPMPPSDGRSFEFIFEKQSGLQGEYAFEIDAPVGFRFRENDLPIFEYSTKEMPARLKFTLTLEEL